MWYVLPLIHKSILSISKGMYISRYKLCYLHIISVNAANANKIIYKKNPKPHILNRNAIDYSYYCPSSLIEDLSKKHIYRSHPQTATLKCGKTRKHLKNPHIFAVAAIAKGWWIILLISENPIHFQSSLLYNQRWHIARNVIVLLDFTDLNLKLFV